MRSIFNFRMAVIALILSLTSAHALFSILYVTNQTGDNTIVVSFTKNSGSTDSLTVPPSSMQSYDNSGSTLNNFTFAISGPTPGNVKITGLQGEQYVPRATGYFVNANNNSPITIGPVDFWQLWIKKEKQVYN